MDKDNKHVSNLNDSDPAMVAGKILEIIKDLGLNRMPTYTEIARHEGKSSLCTYISHTGGIKVWGEKLGISTTSSTAPATCKYCGKHFVKTRANQIYCSASCSQKYRDSIRPFKKKRVIEPSSADTDTTCKRKDTCKYGVQLSGFWACDYILHTGTARKKHGAECEYYERKKRARKNKAFPIY